MSQAAEAAAYQVTDEPESRPGGLPLYVWVLIAVVLAIPTGLLLGVDASWADKLPAFVVKILSGFAVAFDLIPKLIIRALGALAAPLIVLAILSAIITNDIHGRQGLKMMGYYLINTLVAMIIGLVLSNLLTPGRGADLGSIGAGNENRLVNVLVPLPSKEVALPPSKTLVEILSEMVPRSIGDAVVTNNLAQLVLITLSLAIGLTYIRNEQRARGESTYLTIVNLVTIGFELLMKVLLWVVALVPLAVFGVVAMSIGRQGFELFLNLGWFILVVLIGLTFQIIWYLLQLGTLARMSPARFLKSARDVMATTFSTASTAATIPFTLDALIGKLGISRGNAQLAACVGTNFNNDGTALYQASAALFFAQALGGDLPLASQIIVVITTLIASVGAGGIPSGSFVTLPLIFAAVNLPPEKLPILLTIDWFLDRCRTTSNVLGDMTVAVLLDKGPSSPSQQPAIESQIAVDNNAKGELTLDPGPGSPAQS